MKYNANNKPLVCMMTQSTCYKGTKEMTVKGILFHSTGANNPNIKRYVQPDDNASNKNELIKIIGKNAYGNDWNHITRKAGLNAWIGKLADGSVASVQTMPWNYRPWGCGSGSKGSCNDGWIQFEICEDALTNKDYFEKVYKEACELTAYLCKMFKIDPKGTTTLNGVTVPTILCHQDSYKLKLGSNHSDIYHWFNKHGKNMDTVRADVAELLNPKPVVTTSFKAGDIVKITGSKYYTGKAVPTWVLKKNWVVRSVSGDRVVLGKSADGKDAIMSPFNAKDLATISTTNTTTTTTKPVAATPVNNNKIVKGSIVSIANGAKYYTGASIPSWVIKKTWVVKDNPVGDRVVIDKSADGKNAICSAISTKYLTVVNSATAETKPSVVQTTKEIKQGSRVKVKSGAKTYAGGSLSSFVYNTTYTVLQEPKGDRVVIGLNGAVTAAVNKKDLIVM